MALNQEEVIKRFKKVHGDKYDYSKVNYKRTDTKVEIICPEHGSFFQIPLSHFKGIGCSKCGGKKIAKSKRIDKKVILKRFKEKFKDKYDYSKSNIIDMNTPIEIICPEHGSFFQKPEIHLRKHGCPQCGKKIGGRKTRNNFSNDIKRFKEIHGNKYNYVNNYMTQHKKIEIICPEHGSFFQLPYNHLSGSGCPKCSINKQENFITDFIKSNFPEINIINNYRFKSSIDNKIYEVDIYLPDYNFGIEYNGTFWHSLTSEKIAVSKKQLDPYYNKTRHLNKFKACTSKNIDLFMITDYEFLDPIKKNIWLSKILLKLGKVNNKIHARKCIIKEVPKDISKKFQEENHLQGSINSKFHYGLYYNEELVQLFTLGNSRYNKNFDFEIHRICTLKNTIVMGGVSKLFKSILKVHNNSKIITYANRRWSALNNSNLYMKLGLEYIEESSPNFIVCKPNVKKIYKRGTFQKHKLKDIPNFVYDPAETAQQNILNNGYIINWDCGNGVYMNKYKNYS